MWSGPAAGADPSATRIVGADRYDTARKVAEDFFSPTVVGIASGANFPDAMSGGAHMGNKGGPMLFVEPAALPSFTHDYLLANSTSIASAYVYGGTAAVAGSVASAVQNAISGVS
jgi:hypothetical protein